jgi:hypothetical protein
MFYFFDKVSTLSSSITDRAVATIIINMFDTSVTHRCVRECAIEL